MIVNTMKSTPSTSWHHCQNSSILRLRPIILPSPPVKLSNGSSIKMKNRKRTSPKPNNNPLPSISTLFESTSSSLSSSSNSSYGSYCQFSPEGTYTMYNCPANNDTFWQSYQSYTTASQQQQNQVQTQTSAMSTASASVLDANERKPLNQPLFIQTSDEVNFGEYSSYPSTSVINANELLLRPVPNGTC